jgi:hypothetical protein
MDAPVMYDAAGLARNATTAPTSSGRPYRPSAVSGVRIGASGQLQLPTRAIHL